MLRAALLAIAVLLAVPAAARRPRVRRVRAARPIQVPLDHSGATAGSAPARLRRGAGDRNVGRHDRDPQRRARPVGDPADPRRDRAAGAGSTSSYDLVSVDQRGTGESGAVAVQGRSPRRRVAACAAKLGDKRAFLNTTETAHRPRGPARGARRRQAVRCSASPTGRRSRASTRAASRSTRPAWCSTRPVRSTALDGYVRAAQVAMPRVLRDVVREGAVPAHGARPGRRAARCGAAAPARAAEGAVRAPRAGRVKTETLSESTLYGALLTGDESPLIRAVSCPPRVESVAKGDAAPLLHLEALLTSGGPIDEEDSGINTARLLATSCIECQAAVGAGLAGRRARGRVARVPGRQRRRRSRRSRPRPSRRSRRVAVHRVAADAEARGRAVRPGRTCRCSCSPAARTCARRRRTRAGSRRSTRPRASSACPTSATRC